MLNDTLSVYFSIDCGANWYPLWSKGGSDLSNNQSNNAAFIYTNQSLTSVSLNLCSYENFFCGFKKIRFKFENKSGGGNQVYLDNINISYLTKIDDLEQSKIKFYPNPNAHILYFEQEKFIDANVKIYSISGQLLNEFALTGSLTRFDTKKLANGIYFVEITEEKSLKTKMEKLIIKH